MAIEQSSKTAKQANSHHNVFPRFEACRGVSIMLRCGNFLRLARRLLLVVLFPFLGIYWSGRHMSLARSLGLADISTAFLVIMLVFLLLNDLLSLLLLLRHLVLPGHWSFAFLTLPQLFLNLAQIIADSSVEPFSILIQSHGLAR